MENILQEHHNGIPAREVLVSLAEKFSASAERKGKIVVQMKQVWNWFQNRRYAVRAKSSTAPLKLNVTPMSRDDSIPVRTVPQSVAALIPAPTPTPAPVPAVPPAVRGVSENSYTMEFEAKSGRDGAWYDVAAFLAHRYLEMGDHEVEVRFAGFGPEEDEWVNIHKHVRQRSLPCEASECVAVLPGDLLLCFQEGKDQALYFDAHVLDAQRRRHDVRGCRCRFLVKYVHDQAEEIVPLRKICRRPETDYRLQQLHAMNNSATADLLKGGMDPSIASAPRFIGSSTEMFPKPYIADQSMTTPSQQTPVVSASAETVMTVNLGNNYTPGDSIVKIVGTAPIFVSGENMQAV
ncbi:protein SAWADEE HOMEODOMAIN HOMOLOG 2-like isoform X2 [Tripterygium wilfordii]|nr:protein SAWADEE HOMEODOMAIN HOMOLOG 2-like isoform X2 [Tripterygium wilfordii]XP_038685208.1 protein SAWADEE HOMEODOMAIN HOMOLOG 2-like isoform X2 [Tripterygium wilfordii]